MNEKEKELNRLDNFIKELRKLYVDKRQSLVNADEKDLDENKDFQMCMKIAAILSTISSTRPSFETFFILAKDQCNFDVNKFLDLFEIKWEIKDGTKIPHLIPKENE